MAESAVQRCPECGSSRIYKNGTRTTAEGVVLQRYLCRQCYARFSEPNPYKFSKINNGADQISVILKDAKNLVNPQQKTDVVETYTKTSDQGKIVDFLWHLKKQGYSDATIKTRVKILKLMCKEGVDLGDPEAVKLFIANRESWSNGHRQIAVHAYDGFAEMLGIKWDPPYYENNKALPFVPTEKEVDALISGCSKKLATSLLALKETGFRIGELWRCKWTDLDEENNTLKCVAEKHGNPRQVKISSRLVAMLNKLPKTNEYIFGNTNLSSHRWRFDQQKNALAEKLQNPRLKQIKFHTLRHFKASQEYARTRSLIHVKELLGHRNINSTLVYTHLVPFDDDAEGYYHATAKDDKEAGELIDQGFQYVCTTPQGIMMFRKRK
ncbi:MAG: tyrosine-type recombinase/integrase [Candidatus Bathyarchaeota archaeon]|nr:tyrosine-type recombinase/integrase [Candidatus Bathyarchaeota archaeon]